RALFLKLDDLDGALVQFLFGLLKLDLEGGLVFEDLRPVSLVLLLNGGIGLRLLHDRGGIALGVRRSIRSVLASHRRYCRRLRSRTRSRFSVFVDYFLDDLFNGFFRTVLQ